MSPPVKAPRRYDSTGRQAQARETRARILRAAQARFLAQGYGATTVPAIAQDAGVSAETVYKAFTNKAGLLKAVCDVALVGDDEPVPMSQRTPVREILAEPDPRQKVTIWSRFFVSFAPRAVPVLLVVRGAAANDPGVAAVWDQMLAERRRGMSEFARHLFEGGHLRADINQEEAGDILWALNSPELWEILVLRSGWAPDRYGQWMAKVARDSLFGPLSGTAHDRRSNGP
jgi:AcrR family transcriptional regulator